MRQVHEHVRGVLDDDTPYAAGDPHLLAWVHACEATGFLDAWIAFGDLAMPLADEDTYFAEAGKNAGALGADPVPQTRAGAEALIAVFRPELVSTRRTREVARMVLRQPLASLAMAPVLAKLMQASVEILQRWARDMQRLAPLPFSRPVVWTAASGIAGVFRWAFRQGRP